MKSKKRGRRPKLSKTDVEKLIKFYLSGIRPRELSRQFGISKMTVYRILNEFFSPMQKMDVGEMFIYVRSLTR